MDVVLTGNQVSWSTCGYGFPLDCRDEEGWVREVGVCCYGGYVEKLGILVKTDDKSARGCYKGKCWRLEGHKSGGVSLRRFSGLEGCEIVGSGVVSDVSVGAGADADGGATS